MKLKELPPSLYASMRLLCTPAERLGRPALADRPDAIVSLTSIPSRLALVSIAVRSILDQDEQPQRVILWLHEGLRGRIPRGLARLVGERFTIQFAVLDRPHLKLVASLTEFPGKTVVTCDDDHVYPRSWLRRLWATHEAHPRDIIAHECRIIRYGDDGEPLPYAEWPTESERAHGDRVLALGYGGVLYPPGSLHEDATNRELFEALAPTADDLWFKAMAMRAGTSVRRSERNRPPPLPIPMSQSVSLKRRNVAGDQNRIQWGRLIRHFGLRDG